MSPIVENDHTIVTRHLVFLVYMIAKSVLILWVAVILVALFSIYKAELPVELIHYFLFPVIVILVNYAFIQLALWLVRYYNKLFIIAKDRIILIESSLILQEDIEVMDLSKVMKIDVACHGFFANVFNFGSITIEQQKNEVRILHFVPDPYHILRIIREKTNYASSLNASNQTNSDIAFFTL